MSMILHKKLAIIQQTAMYKPHIPHFVDEVYHTVML